MRVGNKEPESASEVAHLPPLCPIAIHGCPGQRSWDQRGPVGSEVGWGEAVKAWRGLEEGGSPSAPQSCTYTGSLASSFFAWGLSAYL